MAIANARTFALATLSMVVLVPAAHGTVRAPKTTAPNVFVNIQIKITDARITLDRHTANRGDEVRFIIHNVGKKPHSFTFGATTRQAGMQTGFSRAFKPGEQKILLLFLDYRGPLSYRSIVPADRAKPGMKGIFRVL